MTSRDKYRTGFHYIAFHTSKNSPHYELVCLIKSGQITPFQGYSQLDIHNTMNVNDFPFDKFRKTVSTEIEDERLFDITNAYLFSLIKSGQAPSADELYHRAQYLALEKQIESVPSIGLETEEVSNVFE